MKLSLVLAVLAADLSLAAPPKHKTTAYVVKDDHPPSAKWERISRASASHSLTLRIALKQHAYSQLEDRLHEVSDPDHGSYGQWLDQDEIHGFIAPHQDTTDSVRTWLADHGLSDTDWAESAAGDWLYIPLTVEKAEKLLDTEYHVYKHADTGSELVRTPRYSLPAHLHSHIDMIAPTNYFGDIEAQRASLMIAKEDVDPDCSYTPRGYKWVKPGWSKPGSQDIGIPANLTGVCDPNAVTSLCLRTLYRTIGYKPQVPQQNLVAMTAYLNESANISDFHIFLSRQRQDASLDYVYNVTSINDGINMQDPEPEEFYGYRDLEGNLDSQTIGGIVYPSRFLVYSTGGSPPFIPDVSTPENTNEPYLDWLASLLAQPRSDLPNTISTSYSDSEQTVPRSYATRVCQEFAQLTSRGITLLFSSGDNGVGPNGTCVSNDGNETPRFQPNFPPSCPYVTAVGGTRNFQPEIVAYDTRNGYISGSGVSNYFPRPRWQNQAFANYNGQIGTLHADMYNSSGRAYPDISAQGFRYVVVYAGRNIILDGTSCSAPTATGILALVNDALIAAGRPTLGYINPWLYKYGWRGFTDVVNGSTWGCETSGFPAKAGWDLASGWGTPDFLKLRQIVLGGPPTWFFRNS